MGITVQCVVSDDLLERVDAVAAGLRSQALRGSRSQALRLLIEAGLDSFPFARVVDKSGRVPVEVATEILGVQDQVNRAVVDPPATPPRPVHDPSHPGNWPEAQPVKERPAWAQGLATKDEADAVKLERMQQ